ncbi:dihydrolipoamide acetyltransferase family protein [Streptomyces chromofuscus]|uniref:Dihydrolipoamide acetyltransferase component of pyruvate dehydrogenase complex n=1 Tax=Streptomyces chromofuscus TaxID=42881 RepID=A0A7M2T7S8_STRCW|nr:dihydrolipoamide acetyltransferase family protein [Streptomyces chromofuscus]QOV44767.1 2-oxo acid dehydrogenase subunit E2 [Streptomyces chromofuscus]GGT00394.1 acetyltransferase component of pyruvate dehydrogenase complex [Streptomyces chromofuscus]
MAELLRMPEVAANTEEAVLQSWNVELHTRYAAGDPIVTVETEKAVVEVEAESEGVLLQLLVDAGATVTVGTPIAVWGAPGESASAAAAVVASLGNGTVPVAASSEPVPASPPSPSPSPSPSPDEGERLFASPLARRLARRLDVDLRGVVGSGPHGRIRRSDVEAAAARSAQPAPDVPESSRDDVRATASPAVEEARFVDVPISRMRRAIARRLTESKQTTPHFYLRAGAHVDALLELRGQINAGQDVKVSVNDLLVKAIASAHRTVPSMNVQWRDTAVRQFTDVDIAVAVATEGGLVTPVVRGVDSLSMSGVATATRDLIGRAKERRLQQEELEGGTITITNLGMYGTEDFAAIINPPHAAILAVGAARQEAVVEEGEVTVASVLRLTLAVDHRSVDGATAAEWMRVFVDVLEHPLRILL